MGLSNLLILAGITFGIIGGVLLFFAYIKQKTGLIGPGRVFLVAMVACLIFSSLTRTTTPSLPSLSGENSYSETDSPNTRLVCPNCGEEVEKDDKFCPQCGTELSEPEELEVPIHPK